VYVQGPLDKAQKQTQCMSLITLSIVSTKFVHITEQVHKWCSKYNM
jgi:hypothetical protein